MTKCHVCGGDLPSGSASCPTCGMSLESAGGNAEPATELVEEETRRRVQSEPAEGDDRAVPAGSGPETGSAMVDTLPGGVAIEFVYIPPGWFLMGSPESEEDRCETEGPPREVTISRGFYLGRYPVTLDQWQAVTGSRPRWEDEENEYDPMCPAVLVSWDDVQDFLKQLNRMAGWDAYRLPTEAEWEYACRAGTTTRWSFGDDEDLLGDHAWYVENTLYADGNGLRPVGTRAPNPWGLYDMHGNVWEYCQDWHAEDYYRVAPGTDPPGPDDGDERVMKGGGYSDGPETARSAARAETLPEEKDDSTGFRLVRLADRSCIAEAG